jgi:putative ABC transport system permease protein
VNAFLGDLRIATRALIARPAFSALIVGVLGAGLACVIFMLAMLNGFVLRPLPFAAQDELLAAGVYHDGWSSDDLEPVRGNDLLDIRRQFGDLAQVGGFARSTITLADIEVPESEYGAFVSANMFKLLGIAPMLGRDFVSDDERDGAPAVAMLSYGLWHSRYGGDPAVVGRKVRINAQPATVIGVMPEGLFFPANESVWMTGHLFEGMKTDDLSYFIVARRRAGATDAAIATALDTWFAQAAHEDPVRFRGLQASIGSLDEKYIHKWRVHKALYLMLAAVFMLLLVACANAGNLMLARLFGRRQEIAVRIALGATRKRLVAYLLMESVLLSLLSAAFALMVAGAGVSWVAAWFRANDYGPARWKYFDIDGTVLLFTLGAALATALATGLPAAWSASNGAAANNLRDDTRSVAGGSVARLSRILVIGEVALSCALLVSVGMMVRSIVLIDRTDIGIDTAGLLTSRVVLSPNAYPAGVDQLRLYERLTDRFRADSGVADLTVGTAVPGTYWNESRDVLPVGVVPGEGSLPRTRFGAVDDRFLATYGIRLQEGRFFNSGDDIENPRVAVVDRRFVDKYSAGTQVLGRRFRLDPRSPDGATVTVIGVVDAVMLTTQQQPPPQTSLLVPMRQAPASVASVTVRMREGATALAPHLTKLMREIDADMPLDFRDYATVVRGQTRTVHMFAVAFDVLGIVALVLVGAGLYGVMAVSVSRRTREIGVRRALGAPNSKILRNVFARSTTQLAAGLVLGLGFGIPFAKLLDDSLYESGGSSHPIVVGSAVLVIVLAAVMAIIVPARRALRVDPITALRCE